MNVSLIFSLLKHAPIISGFNLGKFLVPKQLELPSVDGVKNTMSRFRSSLVGNPQLCEMHSSSCRWVMNTP